MGQISHTSTPSLGYCSRVSRDPYRGSPHENVEPDPMQIGDPDPKTTLFLHGRRSGPELRVVLRDSASSSAMRVSSCAVWSSRESHIESGSGIQ